MKNYINKTQDRREYKLVKYRVLLTFRVVLEEEVQVAELAVSPGFDANVSLGGILSGGGSTVLVAVIFAIL